MIATISKQGGRRYGQMRSTTIAAIWLASVGPIYAFMPWFAAYANRTVGMEIQPE